MDKDFEYFKGRFDQARDLTKQASKDFAEQLLQSVIESGIIKSYCTLEDYEFEDDGFVVLIYKENNKRYKIRFFFEGFSCDGLMRNLQKSEENIYCLTEVK